MKNLNHYVMFLISFTINALGNALMVKGAIGSIIWTATFENMGAFFGTTVGQMTSIMSVIMYGVSKLIGRDFKIKDTAICIALSILFGYAIDFFSFLINANVQPTNEILSWVYGIGGILLVCASVSLVIEADVAYLAMDDFTKNLKVHVFKGDIVKTVTTSIALGMALALIFGFLNGELINISLVTFGSFLLGYVVEAFDVLFGFKEKSDPLLE